MTRIRAISTALFALFVAAVPLTGTAEAASVPAPRSTTGERYALEITNGLTGESFYVKSDETAAHQYELRASTPATSPSVITTAETFTLHTADNGQTVSLRNEANGSFVSVEDNFTAPYKDMLRARASNIGGSTTAWEKFTLKNDTPGTYTLTSAITGAYVSARFNFSVPADAGLLMATSATHGSWERVTLVPVPNSGQYGDTGNPPAATHSPAGTTTNVMSWNACSNHNSDTACRLSDDDVATVGDAVAAQAATANAGVVFVQEFCEKAAVELENSLESRAVGGVTGWDVRFDPTYRILAGTNVRAQKHCVDSTTGADRGAFGTAVAVPDENTWYSSWVLPSRPDAEQRPFICATVPSQGVAYCDAHFSAGLAGDDLNGGSNTNPDGYYRTQQAQTVFAEAGALRAQGYEVVFGGDLNSTPPDAPPSGGSPTTMLDSLYYQPGVTDTRFEECDQSAYGGLRNGDPTHVDASSSLKIDYIFGPQSADYSCSVTDTGLSDHRMIRAAVGFH